MTGTVESALAEFASSLRVEELPPAVQGFVEDVLVDALANGLVGSVAEGSARVESALREAEGTGSFGVLGPWAPMPLLGAVGQHAYQITAFTMCDVYRPALCHVTPELVPAVLAFAARDLPAGRDLLAGVAAGLEVTTRLGRGLGYGAFRRRGFHAPGIIGPIGAAAGAARTLGLDASATLGALSLAGGGGGTFAALGTEAVKLHQVSGARAGATAVLLAERGLRGGARVLTDTDGGLLGAFSDGGDPDAIVDALGAHWELLALSLRERPGSSSVQAVGECALELRGRDPAAARDAHGSVRVWVPPSAHAMCAEVCWDDQLGAMQSAAFVAAALLRGAGWWVELFDATQRADPELGAAARRVEVLPDDTLPVGAARVELSGDGRTVTASRAHARGDPAEPLGRADVEAKLRRACATAGGMARPDAVLGAVRGLGAAPEATALLDALGVRRVS